MSLNLRKLTGKGLFVLAVWGLVPLAPVALPSPAKAECLEFFCSEHMYWDCDLETCVCVCPDCSPSC